MTRSRRLSRARVGKTTRTPYQTISNNWIEIMRCAREYLNSILCTRDDTSMGWVAHYTNT